MSTTHVDLPTYRITIGHGALAELGDIATQSAPAHRYAIITDANVGPLYAHAARAALGVGRTEVLTLPAGEAHKTRESWSGLTDALLERGFGRDTTIIALGGGVVGDLAGFVAATFMRGVPYIQVPTTLLAMIDASVGGKTGVDTPAGKNLVGAFHQPAAVVADLSVLTTLPLDHLRAGLAEAIKHGVIADADYFETVVSAAPALAAHLTSNAPAVEQIVSRSVAIKAHVVSVDEREAGLRKTLNFGHTIGHAIELCSDYRLLHGEAVAIGMVVESLVAERVGVAERGTFERVRQGIVRAGLPSNRPTSQAPADIVGATRLDKKAREGMVRYALPARVGKMAGDATGWSIPVADQVVLEALQ